MPPGGTVTGMTAVDLVVAGAGPAGAAAALTAARHGLSVVCIDRARFPRDKTCGDGLTTQALRILERLGLTRRDLAAAGYFPVRECVVVSPSGRQAHLPLPTDGDHAGVVAARGTRRRAARARCPRPVSTCAKARPSKSSRSAPTA